ncbi:MAG: exodeoxyribonuclease VII small subunit [Sumerlaeia bacterium]
MSEKTDQPFEKSLERLEAIVAKLESGEASLEKSIALYEEGRKLGQECLGKLESLERRVRLVREEPGGALTKEEFSPSAEES